MKKIQILPGIAVIAAFGAFGSIAYAQDDRTEDQQVDTRMETEAELEADSRAGVEAEAQTEVETTTHMETEALQGVEPMVPVGPAVVPVETVVKQIAPATVPVAPVDTESQAGMQADADEDVEAVVPVGPAVVPVKKVVKQVGPAVVPVAPVEKFEGVETVTLNTESGPVVVVSFPGTVPSSQYNIDFSALDSNQDGYISKAELDANAGRSAAALHLAMEFQRADTNADERLGFTEILGWVY